MQSRGAVRSIALLVWIALAAGQGCGARTLPAGDDQPLVEEDPLPEVAHETDDDGAPAVHGIGVRTLAGGRATFFGAEAASWVELDEESTVIALGVTIPLAAVADASRAAEATLDLPAAAQVKTFFDHLVIAYEPEGEGPAVAYEAPRLALRFFGIDRDRREEIDCAEEPLPGARYLPAPYIVQDPRIAPEGSCIPRLGVRATDPTAPEAKGGPFEAALFVGFHEGQIDVVEVVAGRAFLLGAGEAMIPVPRAEEFARLAGWPGRLHVELDAAAQAYRFRFVDFAPTTCTTSCTVSRRERQPPPEPCDPSLPHL